jgi:hypothetical protein
MPFAMYFDKCYSPELANHPLCVGTINGTEIFNESSKRAAFHILLYKNFTWAASTDIDEIYEKGAKEKFDLIDNSTECFLIHNSWVNLWGDYQHVRTDGPFASGYRCRINNLTPMREGKYKWEWTTRLTNGCILLYSNGVRVKDRLVPMGYSDLVCIHCGLMTHELRLQHKKRWDTVYTRAVGRNPYGIWNYALDYQQYPPVVKENPYL